MWNYIKEHKESLIIKGFIGILILTLIAILIMVGTMIYNKYTAKPVTYESQQEAETVEGVKKAADNARVGISNSQAKEVVREIKYITETQKEPVYIVQTTAKDADKVIKEESKKNKADFSIVTDPNNPEYSFDLSKLNKDDKIQLNQYNIKAYKPVIRTISYAPSEKIVTFSIQKKVTNSGVYLGVGVGRDIDDKKTFVFVNGSW